MNLNYKNNFKRYSKTIKCKKIIHYYLSVFKIDLIKKKIMFIL